MTKNIILLKNPLEVAKWTTTKIIQKVIKKPNTVMGLASGSTQIPVYDELVKISKKRNIDFSKTSGFNLDEYIGIEAFSENSYQYFMNNHLYNHINIKKKNTFFPYSYNLDSFELSEKFLDNYDFSNYDKKIKEKGGLDFQLLGLGTNGHIAFNEPGTSFDTQTHIVELHHETISRNSKLFFEDTHEKAPTKAVSVGISTIMEAKEIYMIVLGESKADIINKVFQYKNKKPSIQIPATILFSHPKVWWILDQTAARKMGN